MLNSKRPLAVITGSSEGIGYELAKRFAAFEFDILVIAETPAVVETVQICRTFNIQIESLVINLAKKGGIEELGRKLASIERSIEALVIITNVSLEKLTIEPFQKEIKHIIKDMVYRQNGRILFISPDAEMIFDPFLLETINKELRNTLISLIVLSTKVINENKKVNSALIAQQVFEILMTDDNKLLETETFSFKDDKSEPLIYLGGTGKLKH